MTRKEAIKVLNMVEAHGLADEAKRLAIKVLEQEPLTDTEKRIFLSAMDREEKVCKIVDEECEGDINLVSICWRIRRKVRKALWND